MLVIPVSAEQEEVKFDPLDFELFDVLSLTTLRTAEGRLWMPGDAFMDMCLTQSLISDGSEVMLVLSWAMWLRFKKSIE